MGLFSKKPNISKITKSIARDLHSKVVGVTYGNADGSSRQEYIRKLKPGEELILRPVPSADYPDAIGVFTLKGKQLGFLGSDLAKEIKIKYPMNFMNVTVTSITGGNGKNYGCNIHIVIYESKSK